MDGLLSMFEEQFKKGEPYRDAFRGLLKGDTSGLKKLNAPTPVNADEALDVAMTFAPLGITAFHGSPYKFDKFDSSKIGSGIGNQLYGKGLYFAESPDIAKQYMSEGVSEPLNKYMATGAANDLTQAFNAGGMNNVNKLIEKYGLKEYEPKINKYFNELSGNQSLYKVDIADETIPKMLNYDKPLSEQPKFIQDIAFSNSKPLVKKLKEYQGNKLNQGIKLDNIYDLTGNDLIKALGGTGKAEGKLQEYGVSGIRYEETPSLLTNTKGKKTLDKTGSGTSNYVVFDPNTVKILERNGLLLP
jgi:hypothetical protein